MDLIGFIDVDIKNPQRYQDFLDRNAIAHQNINDTLRIQGVVVAANPLWTGSVNQDWLDAHSQEHAAWGLALGLGPPPDLDNVDPGNLDAMSDWLSDHVNHHALVAAVLGL